MRFMQRNDKIPLWQRRLLLSIATSICLVVIVILLFGLFEIVRVVAAIFNIYIESPFREKGEIDRHVTTIAWAKTGTSLYYTRTNTLASQSPQTLYRYDVLKQKRFLVGKYDGFLDISPDEQEILVATDGYKRLAIIDIATKVRKNIYLPEISDPSNGSFISQADFDLSWTEAGIIYMSRTDNAINKTSIIHLHCYNPSTQQIHTVSLPSSYEPYGKIFTSTDGSVYGYSASKTQFRIVNRVTNKVINTLDVTNYVHDVLYFSNKRIVLSNDSTGYNTSFDIPSGKREYFNAYTGDDPPTNFKCSPDIRYLAGICNGGNDCLNAEPAILRLYRQK